MKMKLIPDWVNKGLKCHFCGTNLSVKYMVVIKENDTEKEVCSCNRCVFLNEVR